jgi:hypothetical protein
MHGDEDSRYVDQNPVAVFQALVHFAIRIEKWEPEQILC